MSVLDGGIFSRPRGKTGGIVFGAARTRRGKQVTSRLLVPPSNPNTPAQQTQRGIFSSVLDIVKRIGSAIYRTDWNRAVSQLPGFQSMQSIFMNQMSSDKSLTLVNPINLGILHFPDEVTVSHITPTSIEVTWSTEIGDNGTSDDKVKILLIAKGESNRDRVNGIIVDTTNIRDDAGVTIQNVIDGATYEAYFYVVGVGSASGLLSVANPYSSFSA